MYFLDMPKWCQEDTPVLIFEACVAGYTGNPMKPDTITEADEKRARLLKCKDAVSVSAKRYTKSILEVPFQKPNLPDGVDPDELKNVYKEKFAKEDTPGRGYYDKIKLLMKCETCPICGRIAARVHLDHYLPKSSYPTLCVNPNNLIPICDSCNTTKGKKEYSVAEGMPLHMYFDGLPVLLDEFGDSYVETYLHAELDENFVATYSVVRPQSWREGFMNRMENHMRMYELLELYSRSVKFEYSRIYSMWRERMKKHIKSLAKSQRKTIKEVEQNINQQEFLQSIISEGIEREEGHDCNSWQAALYRALEPKVEEFAAWLLENEEDLQTTTQSHSSTADSK